MIIKELLLLSMLFCHIVDDYYLQGILASMKQKKWWKDNAPQDIYRHDYIMALFEHAFSWTFMIHIPIFVYMIINKDITGLFILCSIIINTIIHAVTDNCKANKQIINLVQDQTIHFIQIFITWLIFIILL